MLPEEIKLNNFTFYRCIKSYEVFVGVKICFYCSAKEGKDLNKIQALRFWLKNPEDLVNTSQLGLSVIKVLQRIIDDRIFIKFKNSDEDDKTIVYDLNYLNNDYYENYSGFNLKKFKEFIKKENGKN